MTESDLTKAMKLAIEAHAGQRDKAGQPYILHVLRVMDGVKQHDQQHMVVALLHDTVEDKHLTIEEIEKDFGYTVARAVEALTRLESDSGKMPRYDYETYIKRVATNSIAKYVKRSDLRDNLDRSRIPAPGIQDYERWGRYEWALAYLT